MSDPRRPGRLLSGPVPGWLSAVLLGGWACLVFLRFDVLAWFDLRAALAALTPALPAARFSWENLLEVVERLTLGHATVAVMVAATLGPGLAVLPAVRPRGGWERGEKLALGFGLGAVLAMPAWLALGFLGLWNAGVAWAGCGIGVAAAWYQRRELGPRSSPRWTMGGGVEGVLQRVLAAETAAALLLVAAACLGPEMYADSLVVYLACPEQFVLRHKIFEQPGLLHASFPLGASMLYGWQWLLGGEPAVRAWRVWLAVGTVWLLWRLARRPAAEHAGPLAAALVLTLPMVVVNLVRTSVDMEACALVLAGCLALAGGKWGRVGIGRVAAAGLLCGGAATCKLTALLWAPWLLVVGAMRGKGLTAARGGAFALLTLAALAPWAVRNGLVVGNPVHPFGPGRPGPIMGVSSRALFVAGATGMEDRAFAGWRQAAGEFLRRIVGRTTAAEFSPALLLLLPLLALGGRLRGDALALVLAGGGCLVLSVAVTGVPKYLVGAWVLFVPGLALLGGEASRLQRPVRGMVLATAVVITAGALVRTLPAWRWFFSPVDFLLGRASAAETAASGITNSPVAFARLASRSLPPDVPVLLVADARGLPWNRRVIWNTPYDLQILEREVRFASGPAEIAKRLRRIAPYVYVNDQETARMRVLRSFGMLDFSREEKDRLEAFWDRWVEEVLRRGPQALYRIRNRARPPGSGPPLPESFDLERLRARYGGGIAVRWDGSGGIIALPH